MNSASGNRLHIKYELNNVHVCQDNVCFHILAVLVMNMSNKVILGLPFNAMLYPFSIDETVFQQLKWVLKLDISLLPSLILMLVD